MSCASAFEDALWYQNILEGDKADVDWASWISDGIREDWQQGSSERVATPIDTGAVLTNVAGNPSMENMPTTSGVPCDGTINNSGLETACINPAVLSLDNKVPAQQTVSGTLDTAYPGVISNSGMEMTAVDPAPCSGFSVPSEPDWGLIDQYHGPTTNSGEGMAGSSTISSFDGSQQIDDTVEPLMDLSEGFTFTGPQEMVGVEQVPEVPVPQSAPTMAPPQAATVQDAPADLPGTKGPHLTARELTARGYGQDNGKYRRKKKMEERKAKASVPSRRSSDGATAAPAAAPTRAPNRKGQTPNLPQHLREHKRRCNPFRGCNNDCPLKLHHPDRWEAKRTKRLSKAKRNPSLEGYDEFQTELWETWTPSNMTLDGVYAGKDGYEMPKVPEPKAGKMVRTRLGD